jgi:hypothetical protein
VPSVDEMVSGKPAPQQRRNRSFIRGLGAGLLVGLVLGGMGGSYAANISLGSGRVEFGQGVESAAACDPNIDVVPQASYLDGDGDSYWVMQFITLSDIDVAACSGKVFTLQFTAGIPGGGPLGYDPTLRPYKYVFPIDFIEDSPGAGVGQFWSGYDAVHTTHLYVDNVEVDQGSHGFGAEYYTPGVSYNATDGMVIITTRVLSQDIRGILLESSDQ